jgi:hypothetical protein
MTVPARKTQLPVLHQISKTITYADAGITTGLQVGTLPAGSVLDKTEVLTSTAWNGSVSVALSVGTTLTGTGLINGTDVRTAIARADTVVPAAVAGPLAADTAIYCSIALGGTAGSAGVSTVIVTYHPAIG